MPVEAERCLSSAPVDYDTAWLEAYTVNGRVLIFDSPFHLAVCSTAIRQDSQLSLSD